MTGFTWLKILFSAALIIILIVRIGPADTLAGFSNVDAQFIFAGLFFGIIQILMQWRKWHIAAKIDSPDIDKKHTLISLLSGISLGLITPGRMGELGRALFIQNGNRAGLTALNLLDKMYSFMCICVIGLCGLTFIAYRFPGKIPVSPAFLLVITILTVLLVMMLLLFPRLMTTVLQKAGMLITRNRNGDRFRNISGFNRGKSLELFLFSFIYVAAFLIQYTLFARALEPVRFGDGFAALAASILFMALMPVFFGNLGIREFTAVFFLGILGVSEAAAFDASIMLFFVNTLLPGLAGYLLIMKMKTHAKSDKQYQ